MSIQPVWMMWWGGSSYAPPLCSDAEYFPSICQAVEVFWLRLRNMTMPKTPCVSKEAIAWLTIEHPSDQGDVYPDYVIDIGPRGGIRLNRNP